MHGLNRGRFIDQNLKCSVWGGSLTEGFCWQNFPQHQGGGKLQEGKATSLLRFGCRGVPHQLGFAGFQQMQKKGLKTQALCACVCVCACACTCSAGGCLGATCSEFAHKSHFANSQFTPASWGSLHLSSASYPRPSASLLSWSSLMELVLMERALKSQHEQPAQKLRKQPPPGQAGMSKAAQHHWHLPRLWLV